VKAPAKKAADAKTAVTKKGLVAEAVARKAEAPAKTPAKESRTSSPKTAVAPVSATKTKKPPVQPAPAAADASIRAAEAQRTAARALQPARVAAPVKASPAVGAPAAPLATTAPTTADEGRELVKRNEPPAAVPAEKIDVKPSTKAAPAPAKAKPASQKQGFKLNEFIVYPAHGVGQIVGVETQEVAGFSLELFVVSFIKDKMILKVPTSKVANVGMRKLAEAGIVEKALATLSGRARIKRTMWSRRAQEYEAKINSGDLVTIAEVVRDLYRSDTQPEQSYSERQLYEAALDRMAREISAVRKLIDSEALKLIESFLQKGPRRGQKTDSEAGDDEEDVDRAA
jgi:CarD family transcriptional regulator